MQIAVIIPTLDEEARIGATLRALHERGRPAIVVVADCGSRDRTISNAAAAGAVVHSDPNLDSRAAAMRCGAEIVARRCPGATAWLFLHADSTPAPDWDQAIRDALDDPTVVGGAFDFQWDLTDVPWASRCLLRSFESINRVRIRITRTYFGDQGVFVRPHALRAIGGVPTVSLMEDVILCRRLKQVGRLRLARGHTRTSPRRFLRHGIIRQAAIDATLLGAERLGIHPHRLHAWYNREKA